MGITNFLIVLAFNIYWLIDGGTEEYLAFHIDLLEEHSKVFVILLAWDIWGIANLIYWLYS